MNVMRIVDGDFELDAELDDHGDDFVDSGIIVFGHRVSFDEGSKMTSSTPRVLIFSRSHSPTLRGTRIPPAAIFSSLASLRLIADRKTARALARR
jgi:hypothetical protein